MPPPDGRPALHLTARTGWINDPLALTYHGGEYHLFYQYVPGQPEWDPRCRWGHATSPDLLRWTEHQPALEPDEEDFGCWSGSLVASAPERPAVIFYTAVPEEDFEIGAVRTARSTDARWMTWTKHDVVASAPPGLDLRVFRDPQVSWVDGEWVMLVGGGLEDGTACALTWTSADLGDWTYRGMLASRHRDVRVPEWTGGMWECPQLVPVGNRCALVVSIWDERNLHDVTAAVGDYRDRTFIPESWQRLTSGVAYAGSTFRDKSGQLGMIAWLREVTVPGSAWMGAQSCPLRIGLEDARLTLTVHPAIESARRPAEGPAHALDAEWNPRSAEAGAWLRVEGADGSEVARLHTAEREGQHLVVLRALGREAAVARGGGPVRVLVDGPVLEVVAGNQLGALPVLAAGGGVVPVASQPDDLRWWRLEAGRS